VQNILYAVQNKSANGTAIPWTSAVPGASFNWTSVEETRRRRSPDKLKTGKKNPNQVCALVHFVALAAAVLVFCLSFCF